MTEDRSDRLYGIHPILEALQSKQRQFEAIYLQDGRKDHAVNEIRRLARSSGVRVDFKPRDILDRLAGSRHHQGAVGVAAARPYVSVDDLLRRVPPNESPLLLMVDGIEDPHNLGAILRTAEAAAVHGIIIPERRAVGVTAAVVKASAGAVEHLSVARAVNLSRTIEKLKSESFWIYAMDPRSGRNYLKVDYRGPVVLVVGAEGRGVRSLVAEHCDERLSIPMRGRTQSLNASVAAGILLYEVLRQRAGGCVLKPAGTG
jgi:23S rRNA (guanosine2251-2'-O)-methyltransferase